MALGILAFIGAHRPSRGIPRRIPVETDDVYLLHLLTRYLAKLSDRGIRFVEWKKDTAAALQASLEGVSLLGPRSLQVVLGAPKGWIEEVEPTWGTHVISQEPGGSLFGEPYTYRDRSLILRALIKILDLDWTIPELLRVDWSTAKAWTDFEALLAKGKLLDWKFPDLRRAAASRASADIFALVRGREWDSIHQLVERYGWVWLEHHLEDFTVDVARFHLAIDSGRKPSAVSLEGRSPWEMEMIRDAAEETTMEQLVSFGQRIVDLAPVVARRREIGLTLILAGLDS